MSVKNVDYLENTPLDFWVYLFGLVAGTAILFTNPGAVQAVFTGTATTTTVTTNSSTEKSDDFNKLVNAIIGQESGGDHTAVNSMSGALGKAQVMPENVVTWSEECLGKTVSTEEFKADESLQDQVIECKLKQYWDDALEAAGGDIDTAVMRVASAWYSGDPSLYSDTKPQAGGYPSINSYAQQVLEKFKSSSASTESTAATTTTTTTTSSPLFSRIQQGLMVMLGGSTSVGTVAAPVAANGDLSASVFRMGSATGWVANDGYAYTATHVIDAFNNGKYTMADVVTQSGEPCEFEVIEQVADATRMKVTGACADLPKVSLGTYEPGEAMTAYGFPGGKDLFEAKGKAGEVNGDAMNHQAIEFLPDSLPGLQAGMSGGLCAGSDGAAIGVVSNGTNPKGQHNEGDRAWCAPLPDSWLSGSTSK